MSGSTTLYEGTVSFVVAAFALGVAFSFVLVQYRYWPSYILFVKHMGTTAHRNFFVFYVADIF